VLFLDELPEFARASLEALREPLECGRITISRAARQAVFPARFQLVAAMNPCPCGWLGAPAGSPQRCRCTPDQVQRYQSKISGPLLDRIDMQVEVQAAAPSAMLSDADGDATAIVAQRVNAARVRQLQRQGGVNAEIEPGLIDTHCALDAAAAQFAEKAARQLGWSGRSLHRVIKLARTIADLGDAARIDATHLAEAMQLRRGLPAG
jgi:magnesium chelatase family protein